VDATAIAIRNKYMGKKGREGRERESEREREREREREKDKEWRISYSLSM
jgi:hypothetical protein